MNDRGFEDEKKPEDSEKRHPAPKEANIHPIEQMDVETRALIYRVADDLQRQRLTGLGGWLACFIVIYILNLLLVGYNYLDPTDPYEVMELGLTRLNPIWPLADIAWAFLVCASLVLLFRRKRNAPKICSVMLIFGFVQDTLYTINDPENLLALIEQEMNMNVTVLCVVSVLAHLGYALAWLSYFNKSRRVKYTFGLDMPEDKIGKVFQ